VKGLVDVVMVYKVDRLTRSLADFAKMVELFDAHGVSFVAVTQQFNTTTSMGRLTLNVLLSFAQFEREVTGEQHPRQDRCLQAARACGWGACRRSATTFASGGWSLILRKPKLSSTSISATLELGCVRQLEQGTGAERDKVESPRLAQRHQVGRVAGSLVEHCTSCWPTRFT